MEITLEKIELVKDRTGVTYKEAKEALEKSGGNVVDAIIAIEQAMDQSSSSKFRSQKDDLIKKIKDVIKKGNISRILVTRGGDTILNIPLSVGIVGTIVAPWGIIAGVAAAFGFKCRIEFIKDDGSVIDLTEKAENMYEGARENCTGIYEGIKEKAPNVYEDIKDRGEEAFSRAKDAAKDVKDKLKKEMKSKKNTNPEDAAKDECAPSSEVCEGEKPKECEASCSDKSEGSDREKKEEDSCETKEPKQE